MSSRSVKMLSNVDLIGALSFSSNPSEFIATEKPTLTVKDGVPHMCVVVGGIPVWGKIINEDAVYVHVQETASAVWTITHNKESIDYAISVFDASGEVVNAFTKTVDANTVEVDFGVAVTGRAVLVFNGGSASGGSSTPAPQTGLADPWSTSAESSTYTYAGDRVIRLDQVVNGLPRATTYQYDDANNITSTVTTYNGQRRTVVYGYDEFGKISTIVATITEI